MFIWPLFSTIENALFATWLSSGDSVRQKALRELQTGFCHLKQKLLGCPIVKTKAVRSGLHSLKISVALF